MKTEPLRVALFGAGGYGASHLQILEELHGEGRAVFVAVADPATLNPDGEQRFADLGVRRFRDHERLLGELAGELDAVVISAPIPWHLPMLEGSIENRLAVYLEKPPVPLIQDFLRVGERPGISRVATAFQLIADPELGRLKQALLAGELGTLKRMAAVAGVPRFDSYYKRSSWAGRVLWNSLAVMDGPATNALAHIVHNMMFLAGRRMDDFLAPELVRAELYRARPMESYDLCTAVGHWPSGMDFSLGFTHACAETLTWSILVEGTRGSAVFDARGIVRSSSPGLLTQRAGPPNLFRSAWLDFLEFASGSRDRPLTAWQDCLPYVRLTNAMFASAGGITPLPSDSFSRMEFNGDAGYDIHGILPALLSLQREGKSLLEQRIPWARAGDPVDIPALSALSLSPFCHRA